MSKENEAQAEAQAPAQLQLPQAPALIITKVSNGVVVTDIRTNAIHVFNTKTALVGFLEQTLGI